MRILVTLAALPLLAQAPGPIQLPAPTQGPVALDKALKERRTTRSLVGPALTLPEAAQLLWAAQGENRPGKRTVPSSHGRYPLEVLLVAEGSATLPSGTYRYVPKDHALVRIGEKGVAALFGPVKGMQPWIAQSPAVFLISGVPGRLSGGDPAAKEAYTFWEAGAASQALLLEAAALGLGAGVASGVDFQALKVALALPPDEKPIVLLPVGRVK